MTILKWIVVVAAALSPLWYYPLVFLALEGKERYTRGRPY